MRSCGEGEIERRRDRCDHPTSGATSGVIDERARRTIAPLDERARRSCCSSIPIVDRAARRSTFGAVRLSYEWCDRRSDSSSLSPIWALSSLSLSLFSEMI